MQCVNTKHVVEELVKKSRFIGVIFPTPTEPAALQQIHALHLEHPHASHIVFAYRILSPDGLVCRFHDAGEPCGTAGKPVFHHLEGKNIINTTVAVIRYFGGIKLGAGGLTRAYGNCAGAVIEKAEFNEYVITDRLLLTLDYQQLQEFEYYLKKHSGIIIEQQFSAQIRLTIELPQAETKSLLQRFSRLTYQARQ